MYVGDIIIIADCCCLARDLTANNQLKSLFTLGDAAGGGGGGGGVLLSFSTSALLGFTASGLRTMHNKRSVKSKQSN